MSALVRRVVPLFAFLTVLVLAAHANAAKYEIKVPDLVQGDDAFSVIDGFELASTRPEGRRRGAVKITGLKITRDLDWRSPKYFGWHLKGKVFPTVKLRIKDAGKVIYVITLTNAKIKEVQHKTNAKTGKTKEQVVFSFEQIAWKANNGPDGPVTDSWAVEQD